jgi:predicted lipid-binding transport protein (Tim44 family)
MLRTLSAASLVALASLAPVQEAAAQDPIAGGILGGVAGGLLGGAIGGRGGAVAGAIIGGTTGAAIGAQGQRRANGYYWYNNGCYAQRPDGAWVAIPPEYCGAPPVAVAPPPPPPGYGPPPAYGAPPVAAAVDDDEVEYIQQPGARAASADAIEACAQKFRSYDRRTMTFLSTDGTRKACPSR